MSQTFNLGKSVFDNSWRMFVTFLEYKLKEWGKLLVKLDKWFPSTKRCSRCGKENEISLSERIYKCSCGLVLDRDYNAAINIKSEGLRLLTLT
jgi:putative transposase